MHYTVRSGDYLSKIASEHGFANWRTIYDDPHNAEFRRLRPNPNLIYPGDQLFIPEKPAKTATAPAGGESRFRAHRATGTLQLTLLDFAGEPLANKSGTLEVEGTARPITTDGSGHFTAEIPPHLTHAVLTIDDTELVLRIGQLNPMTDVDTGDVSGVQGRLANLGYLAGAIDGVLGEETREAIRAFQRANDLAETGEVSRPLEDKLREKYGS